MRWSIEQFIRRGLTGWLGLLLAAGGSAELLRIALVSDATKLKFSARIQAGAERTARGKMDGVSLELLCRPGDRAGQVRTVEESMCDGVDVVIIENVAASRGRFVFRDRWSMDGTKRTGHDTCPAIVDWNGDGIPDLLVGAEDGHLYYLENPRTANRTPES